MPTYMSYGLQSIISGDQTDCRSIFIVVDIATCTVSGGYLQVLALRVGQAQASSRYILDLMHHRI